MDITYRQWIYFRDRVKEELAKLGKGRDPKAEFSKLEFSWDFHHIYPPSTTRLHFQYDEATHQLTGWRGSNWTEGPFGPQRVIFDEKYLQSVTKISLDELKELDESKGKV